MSWEGVTRILLTVTRKACHSHFPCLAPGQLVRPVTAGRAYLVGKASVGSLGGTYPTGMFERGQSRQDLAASEHTTYLTHTHTHTHTN